MDTVIVACHRRRTDVCVLSYLSIADIREMRNFGPLTDLTVFDLHKLPGKRSFGQELAERIEMLSDIFDYALKSRITTFANKFPVLFALAINNIYIGHSADEAVENLRIQEKIRFVMESYKNLPAQSDEFFRLDNSEIKKIKYKYHMYIRSSLIGSTGIEKIKLSLYNCYREIKGEEKIEKWKMPY